jgi:hypothetical protein
MQRNGETSNKHSLSRKLLSTRNRITYKVLDKYPVADIIQKRGRGVCNEILVYCVHLPISHVGHLCREKTIMGSGHMVHASVSQPVEGKEYVGI